MKRQTLSLFLVLLLGCQLPIGHSGKEASGTLQVRLPSLATWVTTALAPQTNSRSLAYANAFDFTVKTPEGEVVASWHEGSGVFSDPQPDQDSPKAEGTASQVINLAPGTYRLEVQVFNTHFSVNAPVVQGWSDFTITSGQTTGVALVCQPVNPTVVTENTPLSFEVVGSGTRLWNFDDPNSPIPGSEAWFTFVATSASSRVSVASADGSLAKPMMAVFGPDGRWLGADKASQEADPSFEFATEPGQTYSAVVLDFGPAGDGRQMTILAEPVTAVEENFTFQGILDTDFGPQGLQAFAGPFPNGVQPSALAASGTNAVLVAGFGYEADGLTARSWLRRYRADGSLDLTFGVDGQVLVNVENSPTWVRAVQQGTDGTIWVAGDYEQDGYRDWFVGRYDTSGTLTSGGMYSFICGTASSDEFLDGLTLGPDGRVFFYGRTSGNTTLRLSALDPDGSWDQDAFDTNSDGTGDSWTINYTQGETISLIPGDLLTLADEFYLTLARQEGGASSAQLVHLNALGQWQNPSSGEGFEGGQAGINTGAEPFDVSDAYDPRGVVLGDRIVAATSLYAAEQSGILVQEITPTGEDLETLVEPTRTNAFLVDLVAQDADTLAVLGSNTLADRTQAWVSFQNGPALLTVYDEAGSQGLLMAKRADGRLIVAGRTGAGMESKVWLTAIE